MLCSYNHACSAPLGSYKEGVRGPHLLPLPTSAAARWLQATAAPASWGMGRA